MEVFLLRLIVSSGIVSAAPNRTAGVSMKIIRVEEVIYGFSHYYTVFYEDGSWEHVFYHSKEMEDLLREFQNEH